MDTIIFCWVLCWAIFAGVNAQKEINALLYLIEDPDQEVFEVVSSRILSFGSPIIPNLENLWENSPDDQVQHRIEMLIHRLHFESRRVEFLNWKGSAEPELMPGTLLVSKILYPDLDSEKIIRDVERLKRNIWLELNNYLTPLEITQVMKSILYNYFGLKGDYNQYDRPDDFLVSRVMETKKGNQTGIGVLYLLLAELLDIPVKLIPIPGQFVLAYFRKSLAKTDENPQKYIEFFIDPVTGQAFTYNDLNNYLKRVQIASKDEFFFPATSVQVIQKQLKELKKCYTDPGKLYLKEELDLLINLLNDTA